MNEERIMIVGKISLTGIDFFDLDRETMMNARLGATGLNCAGLLNKFGLWDDVKDEDNIHLNELRKNSKFFLDSFDKKDTLVFEANLTRDQIEKIKNDGSFANAVDLILAYEENKMKCLKTPSNKNKLFEKIIEGLESRDPHSKF